MGDYMRKDVPQYVVALTKQLRANQTNAEKILWDRLCNRQLGGLKFRSQYAIGRYIADFYCSSERLIIELDGSHHYSADNKEYDKIRDNELRGKGLKVLRFNNSEIFSNIDKVVQQILSLKSHYDTPTEH